MFTGLKIPSSDGAAEVEAFKSGTAELLGKAPITVPITPPSSIPRASSDMTDIVATSVGIKDGERSLMYHS